MRLALFIGVTAIFILAACYQRKDDFPRIDLVIPAVPECPK